MPVMLTLKSASERYDVKISTLRTYIAQGRLKASKAGRDWRVAIAELDRFFGNIEHEPIQARRTIRAIR